MRKNARTRPAIFSHLTLLLAVVAIGGLALFGGARTAKAATGAFNFATAGVTVTEGGSPAVVINRTGGTSGAITVGWQLTYGAGAVVGDLNLACTPTCFVGFGDGVSSVNLGIVTTDDGSMQGSRTITFTIVSADNGGTVGVTQPTFALTINDNDGPPSFSFSSSNFNVGEGDGVATVTVNRAGLIGSAVSVKYETIVSGAATAGVDYTAIAPTTLSFAIGQTSKTFNVTILEDLLVEGTETFGVRLSAPSNGGSVGSDSTVSILDNEGAGTVQFSSSAYSVGEAGIAVTITVNRVTGSSGAVSVQYSTSNGSAAAGLDYTATGLTTLNFANGETIKTFNVTILDDLLVEGNETFFVTLSNPIGTSITGSNPATVTIVDNDGSSLVPVVSSVSPSFGPVTGGTYVTITGANFIPAGTTVFFGATAATPTTNTGSIITVFSPVHVAGTVDITVQTINGTSATSIFDQFTYGSTGLAVTNVSPNGGPPTGGTVVAITGSGFTGATSVTFGGTAALSFFVVTDNSITATAPPHALGTVDVIVGNGSAFSPNTLADNYTYTLGPTITSITPTTGPSSGGTIVTITGTGFTGSPITVAFGGINAPTFGVTTSTSITVVSPAGSAGVVDVTVTTPGGTSPTSVADQFTYTGASLPVVTVVSPSSGPAAGGTLVTITGAGFTGATSVTFGGTSASFTIVSDTTISATSPAHTSGVVHVIVSGPAGSSTATTADQFTYTGAATTTYSLSFRWTIIVWLGQDGASAISMLQGSGSGTNNVSSIVTAIFRWDPAGQVWLAFFTAGAGVPGANDFTTLSKGQAYFIAVNTATSWTVTLG